MIPDAGPREPGGTHTTAAQAARRRFLARVVGAAGGAALLGVGLVLHARQAAALPAFALRPPGALREPAFLAACLRCGLCVRACPYDSLRLGDAGREVAVGTPFFVPRTIPCEMCPDLPCVKACPSGALARSLEDVNEARMGLAVLVDQETCLNFNGLRCDVCYRVCPRIDRAITLDVQRNARTGKHAVFLPVVHSSACTGCGKCERACVLETAAIKVLPVAQAKGELGSHYRLGWQEKAKAGKSLLPHDVLELPVRRPGGGT